MKKSCILGFLLAITCIPSIRASEIPRLVVVIVIDQMRAEHFGSFSKEYSAGFQRLLSEGVVYLNADLGYAGTATAPGHATLSTGVYPARSGIVGNSFIDRKTNRRVYSVEDSSVAAVEGQGGARSPRNLMASTFADWLKAASPKSKVISISYKDRPAVLMGGKKPDHVFWYDRRSGDMVTSSYYVKSLPDWARAFNASKWVETNLPSAWTKIAPDSIYEHYGPDSLEGESLWNGSASFPHPFRPDKKASQAFDSPYGNSMLLDFARQALYKENLGRRNVTDLLCISLSSTDLIGSSFGPNSHEMIDNLVRLDLDLDLFLKDLAAVCGRDRLLVVLTGDHGVMPLPEYLTNVEHRSARRLNIGKEVQRTLTRIDSLLRREFAVSETLVRDGFINYSMLRRLGKDPRNVEKEIRERLLGIDGIVDVYFGTELLDPKTPQRPYLEAYRRSFLPERSPDFFVRNCEYCLATESNMGTGHGSPYAYDARVPILFWGPKYDARKIERTVHTVDIAPTLARMLNLVTPSNLDGRVLKEVSQRGVN